MKLLSFFIGLTGLICFSSLALSEEVLHVANIKNMEGSILVLRGTQQVPAEPGMQLYSSDTIISSSESTAGVIFTDGTSLAVGPSTEINIQNYLFQPHNKKYDFSLYMKKGSALYSTGKLGKLSPESVKLNTPRATVGVRGTRFLVKVE